MEERGLGQVKLTAEAGWLLKSTKSGKTYKSIDTLDVKRWDVVEDPDFKPAAAGIADKKTTSKPRAAKRASRKEKK